LALSGEYRDWSGIELALRVDGYPEARGELDSHFKREWLNKLCQQAQESQRNGNRDSGMR